MDVIRTERLLLRGARAADLDALHAILSDARAMRYWSTLPHSSVEQTRTWLDAMMAIDSAEGEDFVIVHDSDVIGKAGLYRFPEIGFILHPEAWGRGLAREALRPILGRAFAIHRLPAVVADVDPRNAASLGLLSSLGFEKVGDAQRTFQVGEEWCDSIYLELSHAAWSDAGYSDR